MNYEKMSDKEIGFAVTAEIYDVNGWSLTKDESEFYQCGPDGMSYYSVKVIDIDNPADMWPIIDELKISLHWDWEAMGECSAIGSVFLNRSLGLRQINYLYTSKNPLRAAAIVFLMMKDAEKAQ